MSPGLRLFGARFSICSLSLSLFLFVFSSLITPVFLACLPLFSFVAVFAVFDHEEMPPASPSRPSVSLPAGRSNAIAVAVSLSAGSRITADSKSLG